MNAFKFILWLLIGFPCLILFVGLRISAGFMEKETKKYGLTIDYIAMYLLLGLSSIPGVILTLFEDSL